MGIFGPQSNRSSSRRGETLAVDEFSFHVPQHCDARTSRLEVDCFKRKPERRTKMVQKHVNSQNSLESLKSESGSDFSDVGPPISQEVELCLAFEDFELSSANSYLRGYNRNSWACHDSTLSVHTPPRIDPRQSILYPRSSRRNTTRVILYPEEGWAKNAKTIQWTIKPNKWRKRCCTVTESNLGGFQNTSAEAKISHNGDGTLTITGRFKRAENPDFKLHLSAHVTQKDSRNGYLMTGALQQGNIKRKSSMEITHFAVIPRHYS